MEVEVDEKDLKAAGAEMFSDGRLGLRIYGREIESCKRSILDSRNLQQWEEKLHTSHFPEMVFGNSCLFLKHVKSGIKIHFNAFDALTGWMQEALPPVEAPAAAKWKFISKYFQQVIIHSQHLTVDLLGIFFNSYLILLSFCNWYVFSLFLELLIFIFGILKIVSS